MTPPRRRAPCAAFVVVAAAAAVFAGGQAAPDAEARRLFDEGRFAEAGAAYAALADGPGGRDVDAEYGAALCAARAGRPAEAAWRLRRALRLAPGDAEARAALSEVEERLGVGAASPEPAAALEDVLARVSFGDWMLAAALGQTLGFAGLFFARRRGVRRVALVVAALGGLAAVRTVQARFFPLAPRATVLADDGLPVVARAGDEARRERVAAGEEVRVLTRRGDGALVAARGGRLAVASAAALGLHD
ncbi:MAG TPA: hypothetical protein VEI02_00635 [Planctomycetota bacterium]|nr:hypothetical protein [Planctomycetota bacterium]